MVELLKTLARWLDFFFENGRYRLVNSAVGTSYGDSLVDFESSILTWRLVRDRGQLFLDCASACAEAETREWYSTDLLVQLIDNRKIDSAELTRKLARWFRKNLKEIEERFSEEERGATERELKRLKDERAKELFG